MPARAQQATGFSLPAPPLTHLGSSRHLLEMLDELNRLQIEFISFREQIDTGGPLGRAIVVIIGCRRRASRPSAAHGNWLRRTLSLTRKESEAYSPFVSGREYA